MCEPEGWTRGTFDGRVYYEVGRPENPTVLLLHEAFGISPPFIEWANELAEDFRVVVPALLDREGRPGPVRGLTALCVRREIHVLATSRTSPVVNHLRQLAVAVVGGNAPYGVVGMCMTGGFALALAVDHRVRAAVVAQPSLPVALAGFSWLPGHDRRARDLGLDTDDESRLAERAREDPDGLQVRLYRFRDDWMCPRERLITAKQLLGPVATSAELVEPNPRAHSTLTGKEASVDAKREVRAFLRERLQSTATG